MPARRIVWWAHCLSFLLSVLLLRGAWAETTIHLSGVPEELSFPVPEGKNVVMTATVAGGKVRSVWLATSADAEGRLLLRPAGDGKYQINLAAPLVSAMLSGAGPTGTFSVFAATEDGRTVASIPVRYSVSSILSGPPLLCVYVGGEKKEILDRRQSRAWERAAYGDDEDAWLWDMGWYAGRSWWFGPQKVDAVEVQFGPHHGAPGADAEIGQRKWPFPAGEVAHTYRLEIDTAMKSLWQEQGTLKVSCRANARTLPTVVLRAIPLELKIASAARTMRVRQRSSSALSGSNQYIRLHLDDITGGQVVLYLSTGERKPVLKRLSVGQGDRVRFSYGGKPYELSVLRLVNVLVGEDYGLFSVSEVTPERAKEAEAERTRIDALLEAIEKSDVLFLRGVDEVDGKTAATHIREKYHSVKPKIASVEDFIEKVAGVSWATGAEYHVRLSDGTVVGAKAWLREQAARIAERPAGEP